MQVLRVPGDSDVFPQKIKSIWGFDVSVKHVKDASNLVIFAKNPSWIRCGIDHFAVTLCPLLSDMLHLSASESLSKVHFCDIFCVFHMLRRRLSSGAAANFSSSSFKFANRFSKSRQSSQNIHCINHNHHKSHAKPHHGGKSRSGICESPCNLQSKLTQLTNSPLHLF